MKWLLEYFADLNYVKITREGFYSLDAQRELLGELVSSEFWRPGIHLYFDNRKLDFGKAGFTLMTGSGNIFQQFQTRLGHGKVAMLMKSTADFGRGRQFQILSESRIPNNMRVFLDEKEALEWIRNEP